LMERLQKTMTTELNPVYKEEKNRRILLGYYQKAFLK